jgi:crotonobetaine/carnitine-CoA ligase
MTTLQGPHLANRLQFIVVAPENLQTSSLVMTGALDAEAARHGSRTVLKLRDGEVSVAQLRAHADRLARGLDRHGVAAGDHVAVMLPNCADFLFVTFALARLGAVMVPINTDYRGALLEHVLTTSDSKLVIVDEPLLGRFADLRLPKLASLIVRMDTPGPIGALDKPAAPLSRLLDRAGDPPRPKLHPHTVQAIMYTSGTTGPSKGVIVPHALAMTCAIDSLAYLDSAGQTIYCPLPLFHAAGLWDAALAALIGGGAVAVVDRFSASRFWDDVRRFRAEVAMGVFAMIPILLKRPARPDDRDHSLRTLYMGKSALDDELFERFGVHAVETYTSTEIGIGTASPYGSWRPGSCGQANRDRYDVRVVDDADRACGPGEPGELVVRPKQPWVMFPGYYGCGDATARAFRNLWFHTGDRATVDDDGYFYFVDRISEAIRRRGENISAFELETGINRHPRVLESAAFGIPSELGDEDVAVAVVSMPGERVSPEEIAAHCEARLPAFMIPRYIELVDELPRSATGKLAKHELKARGRGGLTPNTWDRERATAVKRSRAQ